jgi:hypothetical protein
MDRRRFLSATFLSGIGMVTATGQARAFSEQACDPSSTDTACRELIRHHELLAQLESELVKKGLNESQRKAVLASAICPFCGQPLIG